MNSYKVSTLGAPSKASASTLCQKCLKRDIYECKAVAQERPYVSRPSRTQQLFNPKLVPKLTSDIPQDLLKKKGIANEQLARKEQERGRKHEREEAPEASTSAKRMRSTSSGSSVSVATVSTALSRTSPARDTRRNDDRISPVSIQNAQKKRRRSTSSSRYSHIPDDENNSCDRRTSSRSFRRKIGDSSPTTRGRRRSRGSSQWRQVSSNNESRSRIARDRRPHSPIHKDFDVRSAQPEPLQQSYPRTNDNTRRMYSNVERHDTISGVSRTGPPRNMQQRTQPKERSLSPFSKRLALTQSLNMGR